MNIAVTGATGFLGRYLVNELVSHGHQVRAWRSGRRDVDDQAVRDDFATNDDAKVIDKITWIPGRLGDPDATERLIDGADAVIHAALFRDQQSFMDSPQNPVHYTEVNVIGALRLLQSSAEVGIGRFINVSSGAVHQRVLSDRPLDETHPLWPESLYGANKASVETLVHAYGFGGKLDVCTLRPTAIYGAAQPIETSKWFDLVADVADGKSVQATGGSKEVHAADVATAARLLIETDQPVAGETYNCSDRMISHYEVAELALRLSGSQASINGKRKVAKNAIDTSKLERLGMRFGGTALLEETVSELLNGRS